MTGPGDPTSLRSPRRPTALPSATSQTLRRDDARNRIPPPLAEPRHVKFDHADRLIWVLPRALLGLALTAFMVLGVAAADGDPFEMLAAGAMGLIVTALMMAVWVAVDVWNRGKH